MAEECIKDGEKKVGGGDKRERESGRERER